jgi:aryl-alcohol dehydrogenase-like predicted oxidoreductase
MERRLFLKQTAIAAGLLSLSPARKLIAENRIKKFASDVVSIGKTGIKTSRLAMGTGTHGFNKRSDQSDTLGIKGVAELLKSAFDEGINFWDSADSYGTHPHLKEALKFIPRNKVVILTKTHATTAEEMRSDLDRFRREIGTDYIDILLLHLMWDPDWPQKKQGAMEVLARAREEGIIRAHGVSCHTLGALKAAANCDWVQVDLARVNPAGVEMDADTQTVVKMLNKMRDAGKGVIGMKIFGAGRLLRRVDECLRFTLNLDCIDAFTVGQENKSQTLDLVEKIPELSAA